MPALPGAKVVKGNRDEFQRRIHRRDGPIVLAVLICFGFGRTWQRTGTAWYYVRDFPRGWGVVLGGHRGNDGEIDNHTAVSVARAPRDEVKQLAISAGGASAES